MLSMQHQTAESSSSHKPLPEFDTAMPTASQAPKFSANFGINAINNMISQMPNQPVLNIQCQSREEIGNALSLLFHWTLSKRAQDTSITGPYLASQLVAGFSGLDDTWWR